MVVLLVLVLVLLVLALMLVVGMVTVVVVAVVIRRGPDRSSFSLFDARLRRCRWTSRLSRA